MKKYNKLFITIIIFSITTSAVAQWSKGKGKGYYKLSTWSISATEHYTATAGEKDSNPTRGTFVTSFYGEYGISDKIDIIAFVPFYTVNYQNAVLGSTRGTVISEKAVLNSFGDTDIGLKYGFLRGKVAMSAMLKLGLPTGATTGGHDKAILQAGDGEFNQQLQVDLGIPFKVFSIPSYWKTFGAYNRRTEGFSDEIHVGSEIGFNFLSSKLWLVGRLHILKSTRNGTKSAAAGNGSIFANNIEFTNVGFEAAYYVSKRIGLSYSFASAITGRIISAAPSHSAGIFLDIKSLKPKKPKEESE